MLDLNVEIVPSDPLSCGDENELVMAVEEEEEEVAAGKMLIGGGAEDEQDEESEHSAGTSNSSSVVNEEGSLAIPGDVNSSGAAAAFVFDVFKKNVEGGSPTDIFTRQLFPVPGGGAAELGHGLAPGSRTQWLNLSFAGGGSGSGDPVSPLLAGELRSFQPQKQQQTRKSRRGPRSRSSQYRGVTFYRRTGRWESHIWDCGKQVYLGGFDTAYAAARAYDRAAIKFRGVDADINFSISDYEEDMKQMGNLTKEEFVHILRRQSNGFSRGTSKFRGVALQKNGRWDARTSQFPIKNDHEKAIVAYNGSVMSLEHVGYESEIVLESTGGDNGGHNLDLNLGMAPPPGDSKKIRVAGNYGVSHKDCDPPPSRGSQMADCAHVSAPNKQLPVWPAMYPFLLPSSGGKAVERRTEAPASANIVGWQVPLAPPPPRMLISASNAASSGFSSSSSSSISPSAHHFHKIPAAPESHSKPSQLPVKPPPGSATVVGPYPFFIYRS